MSPNRDISEPGEREGGGGGSVLSISTSFCSGFVGCNCVLGNQVLDEVTHAAICFACTVLTFEDFHTFEIFYRVNILYMVGELQVRDRASFGIGTIGAALELGV